MKFLLIFLILSTLLCVYSEPVLLSLNKPVTGDAYYNSSSEVFPWDNVNDGRFDDTGSPYDWSFWLTASSPGYVIIDLQDAYVLDRFEIQNTHNRIHGDRATKNFRISVSTDNISYTTIITSTLTVYTGTIPIVTYSAGNVIARYVKFNVDTYHMNGGGLNELSVYGSTNVPEPGTLVLFGMFFTLLFGKRFLL